VALQARVAELAMRPLDRAHPLWQFHLVEDHDGGSALIARIHHCIADGIALIAVTMSLMDGGAPPPARQRGRATAGAEDWTAQGLVKPLADMSLKALGVAGAAAARSLGLLLDPKKGTAGTLGVGRLAWQVITDATRSGAHAGPFSHSIEGQARYDQAGGMVPADSAGRGQGRGQGAQLLRSTTYCSAAWPAPSVLTCAPRATQQRARKSARWFR